VTAVWGKNREGKTAVCTDAPDVGEGEHAEGVDGGLLHGLVAGHCR
jgi:hypothetical protein